MVEFFEGGYDGQIMGILIDMVNESTGIKAVQLASDLCVHCKKHNIDIPSTEEYFNYIDELVNAQKIVELDYTLIRMDYRIKTMYFPAGTQFYPIGEVTTTIKEHKET